MGALGVAHPRLGPQEAGAPREEQRLLAVGGAHGPARRGHHITKHRLPLLGWHVIGWRSAGWAGSG